jgi:drug/metabolite transporter (DMT)-like permease
MWSTRFGRLHPRNIHKGIQYILLSTFFFTVVNVLVKLLGKPGELLPELQEYPTHELVFFRSLISLTLTYSLLKYRGLPILGNNKKWLMIRGVFGVIALTSFFYTLKELPIAIAVTVQYLSPLFTVLLAVHLLGERVRPIQWLFFFIALVGIATISFRNQPVDLLTGEEISLFWLLVGIGSAICSGIAYNAILKCKDTDTPLNIVLYFPLLATPVMGIWCLFDFVVPHGIEWLILLAIGLFTQFAQVFMTKALHAGGASKITPFKYLGAIYALFIGLLLFGEVLSAQALVGIGLILLGVLGNAIVKKDKAPVPPEHRPSLIPRFAKFYSRKSAKRNEEID